MSIDARIRGYWREEFALVALLFAFFVGIVVLAYRLPFDARLFPLIVGTVGIVLTLLIGVQELQAVRSEAAVVDADDAVARADWPRLATAVFAAPVFGLVFWLFGFVVASLAAMLAIPRLMGYRDRRRLVLIAIVTVAVLALICPYLLNVELPNGLVGDWLIEKLGLRPV